VYYIFGHRQTNAHEFSRQGVAEKLVGDGNNGFVQAEMTSCGLNGGPLLGKGAYNAGIACNLKSASRVCKTADASKETHPYITQDKPDYEPDGIPDCDGAKDIPQQFICNLHDGSSAGFKYFDINHISGISVEVRGDANGEIICYFTRKGENDAELSVPIEVSSSDNWRMFSAETTVPEGVYALSFMYKGTGGADFKSFTLE
jgi:hypothetical protein